MINTSTKKTTHKYMNIRLLTNTGDGLNKQMNNAMQSWKGKRRRDNLFKVTVLSRKMTQTVPLRCKSKA